jgi:hypothetical protein
LAGAFCRRQRLIGNLWILLHLLRRPLAALIKLFSPARRRRAVKGYPRHMAEGLGDWPPAPRASAWVAERLLGAGAGRRLGRVARATNRIDRYLEIFTALEPALIDGLRDAARSLTRIARRERWRFGDDLNDLLRVDAHLRWLMTSWLAADQC